MFTMLTFDQPMTIGNLDLYQDLTNIITHKIITPWSKSTSIVLNQN